jgi:hypothetical protein
LLPLNPRDVFCCMIHRRGEKFVNCLSFIVSASSSWSHWLLIGAFLPHTFIAVCHLTNRLIQSKIAVSSWFFVEIWPYIVTLSRISMSDTR